MPLHGQSEIRGLITHCLLNYSITETNVKCNVEAGLIQKTIFYEAVNKNWFLDCKNHEGTWKIHAGGEDSEVLSGELISMRRETFARHGKKSRRWLRI
jgi:hypothetical protein